MLKQIVRMAGFWLVLQGATAWVMGASSTLGARSTIAGEQRQWHRITLTFSGPNVTEVDSVNPFRDYRLNVTFKHASSGRTFLVPGYFAADGKAADSGATAGNKWNVHFAPDATGTWTYSVSFRMGRDCAMSTSNTAGVATSFNGESGSFVVEATNKTGADFRAKGRLADVGQHYLQYLGSKEYFIKAGAGSPENFLAYAEFDNTPKGRKALHHYNPHVPHFHSGDPTWKNGKGKGIIGALNYLASKKVNSLYFLTMNVGGDGDDVFPWLSKTDRNRFDVSKLEQWEVVFQHMDRLGINLHVVTQERENDQLLDGGALGAQRKLYYRELVARFGHHLGLTWNLGEETSNTSAQRVAFADYINGLDPYFHPIAVHTWPSERSSVYNALLGNSLISTASLQVESPSIVHAETLKWVSKSAASGQKWVVAVDEIGGAGTGVVPDANDATHSDIMHRVLWGTLMAGGAGVEWYFGYNYSNNDLTAEDFGSRARMWSLTQYATQFFRDYMPLPLATNFDSLTNSTVDYCFGKRGVAFAIFLPDGATTTINLPAGETYSVQWFNPRNGGNLVSGTVASVSGSNAAVGRPPTEQSRDWVALLRRSGASGTSASPAPSGAVGVSSLTTVSKLTLINAAKQTSLRTLSNGATITLSTDGAALSIRADVKGMVGSVAFFLDGKLIQTENVAPFTLAGDIDGTYRKWTPTVGSHILRVVPYTSANRGGSVGTAMETTFTVKK